MILGLEVNGGSRCCKMTQIGLDFVRVATVFFKLRIVIGQSHNQEYQILFVRRLDWIRISRMISCKQWFMLMREPNATGWSNVK
ncbi:hypothetical protein SDJN02_26209 [Cucurbita argyrosperma subsp. argyrosperma]|nr:hypothetical protein SDJN02_26209 [Cucurbita argyrosperma subsp. argyrosperma]